MSRDQQYGSTGDETKGNARVEYIPTKFFHAERAAQGELMAAVLVETGEGDTSRLQVIKTKRG